MAKWILMQASKFENRRRKAARPSAADDTLQAPQHVLRANATASFANQSVNQVNRLALHHVLRAKPAAVFSDKSVRKEKRRRPLMQSQVDRRPDPCMQASAASSSRCSPRESDAKANVSGAGCVSILPPAVQQEGVFRAEPARAVEQCLRVFGRGADGACVRLHIDGRSAGGSYTAQREGRPHVSGRPRIYYYGKQGDELQRVAS